jgi:hypothetical protein
MYLLYSVPECHFNPAHIAPKDVNLESDGVSSGVANVRTY